MEWAGARKRYFSFKYLLRGHQSFLSGPMIALFSTVDVCPGFFSVSLVTSDARNWMRTFTQNYREYCHPWNGQVQGKGIWRVNFVTL